MRIFKIRWGDFGGRQDVGSKVDMVRTYDEEMYECPSAEV